MQTSAAPQSQRFPKTHASFPFPEAFLFPCNQRASKHMCFFKENTHREYPWNSYCSLRFLLSSSIGRKVQTHLLIWILEGQEVLSLHCEAVEEEALSPSPTERYEPFFRGGPVFSTRCFLRNGTVGEYRGTCFFVKEPFWNPFNMSLIGKAHI